MAGFDVLTMYDHCRRLGHQTARVLYDLHDRQDKLDTGLQYESEHRNDCKPDWLGQLMMFGPIRFIIYSLSGRTNTYIYTEMTINSDMFD